MRVAIIVVAIVLVSEPALASPSCMTQSEARAKFATSHLYWHGTGRCWDATPPSRQRLAQRNKTREARQASREAQGDREAVEEKKPQRASNDTKWREAMSKARPEDLAGTSVTASAQVQVSIAPLVAPAPPRMNFWDRWVEIAQRFPAVAEQRTPPIVDRAGPADLAADARGVEPLVTPVRVMLALLVLLLALGAFELLFRRSEWRR